MQDSLDQFDASPDWTQVGGWIASAVMAGAAIWAGFRGHWKGNLPVLPPPDAPVVRTGTIASDGDLAVAALNQLVKTLQSENQRLWDRIKELEKRDENRELRSATRDSAMRDMQAAITRLRTRLVQAGIDPGDGD